MKAFQHVLTGNEGCWCQSYYKIWIVILMEAYEPIQIERE